MNLKFSCVLDYSPLMAVQSYIWLNNLLAIGISPKDIFIHIMDGIPADYEKYLRKKEINLIKSETFDARNRYCNKLQQLTTFENKQDYDYVFLMDCDTAVVSLEALQLTEEIYAKIVDFPNPPLDILEEIFKKNGFKVEETAASFSLNNAHITDWNNCNGGLYIIHRDFLPGLAYRWKDYALRCIENRDLFPAGYEKHADQVGFALAMASLKEKVCHLGIEWNYPIHIPGNNNIVSPKIIHFHKEVDDQLKLKINEHETVNSNIQIINKRIAQAIRTDHLNSLFWDFRYKYFPELGSGVGSRGATKDYKRKVLSSCLEDSRKHSVLDVGCGDLQVIEVFSFQDYLGLDLSQEVINQAKLRKPDWHFKLIFETGFNVESKDIVICLDVLIHQKDIESYNSLVRSLVKHTKKRLIVAAYEHEPNHTSDITFFYESISKSLERFQQFKTIKVIGEYRSTSIIVADKINSNLSPVKSTISNDKKKWYHWFKRLKIER